MAFFTVHSNQEINDMLAYDMYRSFKSAFETIKQNGGTLNDLEDICDSFIPIDTLHPNTIDTPIPDIDDCCGEVTISCKYNMIGVALTGFVHEKAEIQDFTLADAYHAFYKDALSKQYFFHEMEKKYHLRDEVLEHPENLQEGNPLMKFIENEVPFRLTEIHDIADPDKDLVEFITTALKEENDILFDYDAIDNFIEEQVEKYQTQERTKPLDEILRVIVNKTPNDIQNKQLKDTYTQKYEL